MRVLDLFCGMGGFSYGFARERFEVTGVDINPWSEKVFELNGLGQVITADLKEMPELPSADIIVGGPPCRPFSSLNVRKRGKEHQDHILVSVFFRYVVEFRPCVFFFENVLPVRSDPVFQQSLETLCREGYFLRSFCINYSEFGSALARRRFLLLGSREDSFVRALSEDIVENLREKGPVLISVMGKFRHLPEKTFPDHEWPHLKTIHRYREKYRTGKFGWRKLSWDSHAPSFGNVMKTYTLHPDGNRVVSIREAMSIWGFDDDFCFPEGMGKGIRYQMVADAVSPVFSRKLAVAVREILCGVRQELAIHG